VIDELRHLVGDGVRPVIDPARLRRAAHVTAK
jgi:hypothetical protein